MHGGLLEHAAAAADDEAAHSFPFLGLMDQRGPHADRHVARRSPAADSGVRQVVAGMASGCRQLHPAELRIRKRRSPLPGRASEMRQFLKAVDLTRLLIEF